MKIFCNNYDVLYIVEKVLKKCYSTITFLKTSTQSITTENLKLYPETWYVNEKFQCNSRVLYIIRKVI